MERDERGAAEALAEISAQQDAVRQRIAAETWPPPALGPVLGVLAASLAWHNIVWFVVVSAAFLVSLLPLVGTPAKVGVVPRDTRRRSMVLIVAFVFVAATPSIAVLGPWWTAVATGIGAAAFVPLFGRWRRSQERLDLRGPAVRPVSPVSARVDAVARQVWFVPVAAVVLACAILLAAAGRSAAILAFPVVPVLLLRRQLLIGEIPAEQRTTRFRLLAALSSLLIFGVPLLSAQGPGQHRLLPAVCYAAVSAITVVLVGSWQQRRLGGAR